MAGNRARTPGRHLSRAGRSIRLPSANIWNFSTAWGVRSDER